MCRIEPPVTWGEYEYTFEGQHYMSARLSVASRSAPLNTYDRLNEALQSGAVVPGCVDPQDPARTTLRLEFVSTVVCVIVGVFLVAICVAVAAYVLLGVLFVSKGMQDARERYRRRREHGVTLV